MKDVSGQSFKYSGSKYTLQIDLETSDGSHKTVLDNTAMEQFDYETELNGYCIRGSILYTDGYGKIDRYLECQNVTCTVMFAKISEEFDGSIAVEKISDTDYFNVKFVVQEISITKRDSNRISYKIGLVSSNIFDGLKNIAYTNYSKGQEDIFDILKACITAAGMEPDSDSFSAVKSPAKMLYLTDSNDNLFTVSRYLMDRLYYFDNKDDSLKFFFWNESTGRVQLLDLKNKNTLNGSYNLTLSFLKSKLESLTDQDQNDLGTVTRMPMVDAMMNEFMLKQQTYDYETNSFKSQQTGSESLAGYFNSAFDSETAYLVKQKTVGSQWSKSGCFWNNDFTTYWDMHEQLTKQNAMLVDTSGEIQRKPGALMNITIDRQPGQAFEDKADELDDMMTRYHGLEGPYFISRVHHFIYPTQEKYRQALTLVRNFTVDPENKKS